MQLYMKKIVSATIFYPVLAVLAAVLFLFISCSGIDLPYVGYHAFNFNIYSLIAHNYNQFGFIETKFAPVISTAPSLPSSPSYYLHHPPLISIVEAVLFQVLGEHFWVGRVSVIIFSFLSGILFYAIGVQLKDVKFGSVLAAVYYIIPASSLFGRMIGQEALVLTFCLLAFFSLLKFLQTEKKVFLLLLITSIVLGVLSDWPMVYFVAALFPYLYFKKRLQLFFTLLTISIAVAGLYLLYIFLILNSYEDLIQAFMVRSFEAYQINAVWYLKWIALLLIRLVIYANPVIIFLCGLSAVYFIKAKQTLFKHQLPLMFSFALFGVAHVLLYPAGSFGHPYWIYYCFIVITFASASLLYKQPRWVMVAVFLFSLLFLVKVNSWKTNETRANVWRYELAKEVSYLVPRYASIGSDPNPAVDLDVLRYAFLIDAQPIEIENIPDEIQYYLVSCVAKCVTSNRIFLELAAYSYRQFSLDEGEFFLFDLHQPNNTEENQLSVDEESITLVNQSEQIKRKFDIQHLYGAVTGWLGTPEI